MFSEPEQINEISKNMKNTLSIYDVVFCKSERKNIKITIFVVYYFSHS